MTKEYLVVYEKGEKNWSAFSPDIPGCGSLGDNLEETRANMREAMELYLEETVMSGELIPEATATKIDFEEFDPGHETKQYMIEWLSISLPHDLKRTAATQAA